MNKIRDFCLVSRLTRATRGTSGTRGGHWQRCTGGTAVIADVVNDYNALGLDLHSFDAEGEVLDVTMEQLVIGASNRHATGQRRTSTLFQLHFHFFKRLLNCASGSQPSWPQTPVLGLPSCSRTFIWATMSTAACNRRKSLCKHAVTQVPVAGWPRAGVASARQSLTFII